MEQLSSAVMFMVYLYSKLPEAGVACHIGTGGPALNWRFS